MTPLKRIAFAALLVALLIAGMHIPTQAQAYKPVTITNCGLSTTYAAPPERAITMNQAATEVMLSLGLQDQMIGTAYIDDTIWVPLKAAYDKVPVLSTEYPSKEALLGLTPDFIYGSYASAFDDKAAGSRADLPKFGINGYLSPLACDDKSLRAKKVTLDNIYSEIADIGAIFGVSDRATALIDNMKAEVKSAQDTIGTVDKPVNIMWYDSNNNPPSVGAGSGILENIIELAGAKNIFADLDGTWADATWEAVVARNPDAIVLIQADWDTAQSKKDTLNAPAYTGISAVKNKRYVIIDFSYSTAGVRSAAAVEQLARGLYPDKFPATATPEATSDATASATLAATAVATAAQ